MKNSTIFIFLFMMPFIGISQFSFSYDNSTNTVSVSYNGCDDPCRYNELNQEVCNCQQSCEDSERSYYDEYNECLDYCDEDHAQYEYNYELLKECREQCETNLLTDIGQCKNRCGDLQERCTPCGIRYRLIADVAAIPFNPLTDPGSRVFSPWIESGGLDGRWDRCECEDGTLNDDSWAGELEFFELPDSWQHFISSSNRCFGIEVRINYIQCPIPDGVIITPCGQCAGTIWNCEIIG